MAGALGENYDLAVFIGALFCVGDHESERCWAAFAGNEYVAKFMCKPAIERDPAEFGFHDHGRI